MQDWVVLVEAGAPPPPAQAPPLPMTGTENPLPLEHTVSSSSGANLSLRQLQDKFLLRTPTGVCNIGTPPSKPQQEDLEKTLRAKD